MKFTFLGTGTSQGVPVIGCDCEVCQSTDPKDRRLRTSLLVEQADAALVVDAGPDFRQQLLRSGATNVLAILMTHEHNDHIIGMDDVRPLNFMHQRPMSVFAEERVQHELKQRFGYIFSENPYPGAPRIDLQDIDLQGVIEVGPFRVQPIRIFHGSLPVLGYRFGNFTYLTDMNRIEPDEFTKVEGTRFLAIDALHHRTHHSHFNLEQSLAFVERVQPERAFLIHASHRMGRHEDVQPSLPKNVLLAYDGLEIEVI